MDGCDHLRERSDGSYMKHSGGRLCSCERNCQMDGCVRVKDTVRLIVVFMLKKQSNGWLCLSVRNGRGWLCTCEGNCGQIDGCVRVRGTVRRIVVFM